jgi:hypothetical protein
MPYITPIPKGCNGIFCFCTSLRLAGVTKAENDNAEQYLSIKKLIIYN